MTPETQAAVSRLARTIRAGLLPSPDVERVQKALKDAASRFPALARLAGDGAPASAATPLSSLDVTPGEMMQRGRRDESVDQLEAWAVEEFGDQARGAAAEAAVEYERLRGSAGSGMRSSRALYVRRRLAGRFGR